MRYNPETTLYSILAEGFRIVSYEFPTEQAKEEVFQEIGYLATKFISKQIDEYIDSLNVNKGNLLKVGMIVMFGKKIWEVIRVNESRATVQNQANGEKLDISSRAEVKIIVDPTPKQPVKDEIVEVSEDEETLFEGMEENEGTEYFEDELPDDDEEEDEQIQLPLI